MLKTLIVPLISFRKGGAFRLLGSSTCTQHILCFIQLFSFPLLLLHPSFSPMLAAFLLFKSASEVEIDMDFFIFYLVTIYRGGGK